MNERVHAHRKGGNQLVIFDDVDVNIAIEHEVNGEKVPLTYIIRAANEKEYHHINQEIQKAQVKVSTRSRSLLMGKLKYARC